MMTMTGELAANRRAARRQIVCLALSACVCLGGGPLHAEALTRRFHADLSAAGETAYVQSRATGTADMEFDVKTFTLRWKVVFQNLGSMVTGIALHGPVQPGANGIVQLDLAPKGSKGGRVEGVVVLNDAQVQYILAGWTYVDIRTVNYPTGEIRGQLQVRAPEETQD